MYNWFAFSEVDVIAFAVKLLSEMKKKGLKYRKPFGYIITLSRIVANFAGLNEDFGGLKRIIA